MTSLRGHHLICLHFFDGEGYAPAFIRNLRSVLESVEGSSARVTSGPDDVCRECPYLKGDICSYDENADEDIRGMDSQALALLNMSAGSKASWNEIREALPRIFTKWHGSHCKSCDWLKVCIKNPLFRRLLKEKLKSGL